ncbi:MAG: DUF4177 domain-containing protein [Firmicutes bacterium]|nr:DUF4177 domain-containing protein [Bacillota bacterium]
MDKWEYCEIAIKAERVEERKRRRSWFCSAIINEVQIDGMENILNHFGKEGWELVNIIPAYWGADLSCYTVDNFMAIFKRRI